MSDDTHDPDATAPDQVAPEDLVAFAEGRIPRGLAQHEAITAYLGAYPEAAARVQAYSRQDQAIRAAWNGVGDEPVPPQLQPARLAARRVPRGRRATRPLTLAASLLVAVGAGFILGRADISEPDAPADFARGPAATSAATEPVGAAAPPDLSALGLRFVDQQDTDPQDFPYAGPGGNPVHLFRSSERTGETGGVRALEGSGLNLVYWQQDGDVYALAGALELDHLRSLALHSMTRLAGKTTDDGAPPAPAAETEPMLQPELHIAPVPELMQPVGGTDGV